MFCQLISTLAKWECRDWAITEPKRAGLFFQSYFPITMCLAGLTATLGFKTLHSCRFSLRVLQELNTSILHQNYTIPIQSVISSWMKNNEAYTSTMPIYMVRKKLWIYAGYRF